MILDSEAYAAIAIAQGLRFYVKTGMKPGHAYTPKAMMKAATRITGKKFKARAYIEAADALKAWAETRK